jgi:hypothetical protein
MFFVQHELQKRNSSLSSAGNFPQYTLRITNRENNHRQREIFFLLNCLQKSGKNKLVQNEIRCTDNYKFVRCCNDNRTTLNDDSKLKYLDYDLIMLFLFNSSLFRFSNCDKNSSINVTVNYFTIRLSRLLCNLINKISKRRFPKVKVLYRVCDDIVVKLKETNPTLGNVPPQIRNRFFPELWKFYRSIKNS